MWSLKVWNSTDDFCENTTDSILIIFCGAGDQTTALCVSGKRSTAKAHLQPVCLLLIENIHTV